MDKAVEALAASVEKTDKDMASIGDLLVLLNKANADLEKAQEKRKSMEADSRVAALAELNAKKSRDKMTELEAKLSYLHHRTSKFSW